MSKPRYKKHIVLNVFWVSNTVEKFSEDQEA